MFFYQISFEGGYHVTMVFSNKDDIYIYSKSKQKMTMKKF